MKYVVKFNYHWEVEVEADDERDAYRMANMEFPDPFEMPEEFCNELVYDDWSAEEVEE